jgi:hypothetical protein
MRVELTGDTECPPDGFEAREAHRDLSAPLVTAYYIDCISARIKMLPKVHAHFKSTPYIPHSWGTMGLNEGRLSLPSCILPYESN